MALQGTLKDFAIADIFQLIGQQGKSGSLFVVNAEQETHVVFEKGSIVLARFIKSHDDFRLGGLLLRAGLITKEQLESAFDEHKREMKSLGDVLLGRQFISKETLSEFLSLQTKEVLFRILQWKSGVYRFRTEDFNYNKNVIQPISTDFVLMDAFRQIDEWPAIANDVGDMQTVYDITSKGKDALEASDGSAQGEDEDDLDAAFAEFDGQESVSKPQNHPPTELTVNTEEKRVLGLVNGVIPLQMVIDRSRLGLFETCKILRDLKNRFLLQQVRGFQDVSVAMSQRDVLGPQLSSKKILIYGFFYLFFFMSLGLLIFYTTPDIIEAHSNAAHKQILDIDQHNHRTVYAQTNFYKRFKSALDIYRIEKGTYPSTVDALVTEGLLSYEDLKRIGKEHYHYFKSFDDVSIFPPPI